MVGLKFLGLPVSPTCLGGRSYLSLFKVGELFKSMFVGSTNLQGPPTVTELFEYVQELKSKEHLSKLSEL